MTPGEKKQFHQVPGLIAAWCLLALCVSDAQGAVIVKKDGTSISGDFEAEQSIKLLTSSGETSIRLSDIKWMAGSDLRRLRVSGMKSLLAGTLSDPELTIQKIDKDKKKPTSIPTGEIAFLYGGDVDLNKTSEMRIEEYGGEIRVLLYSKSKKKARLLVTLIPENWQGDIQIMKPSYRESLSNREEFTLGIMLRADAGAKASLEKMTTGANAERLSLSVDYLFEGGKSRSSGPIEIKLERDKTASAESYQQQLTKNLGKPFYMEMNGQVVHEISGAGHFYLYIDSGIERLANSQVEIIKTMSNVFRLPINLAK